MSDLLSALLLGILEGLTEFLPISSTGHLLIAQHWLGARSDFFNIIIQAGAILAITLVFRQRLWTLATGLHERANRDYVLKLGTAFLVTAVVGLPVRLAGWELPETVTPVAWALIIGGLWMILVEAYTARLPERDEVTWKVAVLVGVAQVVAGVFPGTSRSAAAIFIAMLFGLSRRAKATEFVFLVGIPTMFAASGYAFLGTGQGRQARQRELDRCRRGLPCRGRHRLRRSEVVAGLHQVAPVHCVRDLPHRTGRGIAALVAGWQLNSPAPA